MTVQGERPGISSPTSRVKGFGHIQQFRGAQAPPTLPPLLPHLAVPSLTRECARGVWDKMARAEGDSKRQRRCRGTGSALSSSPPILPDQTASEGKSGLPRAQRGPTSQHGSGAGGF